MDRGLRTAVWILSSLAVLWTVITLLGVAGMAAMMSGGSTDGGMMRPGGMGGMMDGAMGGGMLMGMMLHMALMWIVMLGLDGVFIYLVVTARRTRRMAEA